MSRKCMGLFFAFLLLGIGLLGCHPAREGNSAKRIAVTQFVTHPGMDAVREGFVAELKNEGHINGRNVEYDFSNANGDFAAAQAIARRIAAGRFDLVFTISTPSTQALVAATRAESMPIIFGSITDPVGAGIVSSLDRGGEHITGTADIWPYDEQFALLMAVVPKARRVGMLYNPAEENSKASVRMASAAARARNLDVVIVSVSNSGEVAAAARSLVGRCDAIYIPADNTVISAIAAVVKVAEQSRIALEPGDTSNVVIGGFGSVGHSYYEVGVESGKVAVRVLRGENPRDIPIVTKYKNDYYFNLRSARAMHVIIPPDLLKKAVKVYQQ